MSNLQKPLLRLAEIMKAVSSNFDLKIILENVVYAISEEIIQCNAVGIYLPEPDGTFRGYVGTPEEMNGLSITEMVIHPDRDGLVHTIINTKQSVYIPNTQVDYLSDKTPVNLFGIQSLFALPITFEEEIFGLIFIFNSGTPMYLTEEEIQAVETYVDIAGVAIRNTNIFAQKQLLLDATRDLSLCKTIKETVQTSFHYLELAIKNPNAAIHLSDQKGGFFPFHLDSNSEWTEEQWRGVHEQAKVDFENDHAFQHVVRTKRPLVIPDVMQDPRPNHEACKMFGIGGLFLIPLVAAGEIIGVIGVPNLGTPRDYSNDQVRLAASIANSTASTLSELRQIESLENQVELHTSKLRLSNEILKVTVEDLQRLSERHSVILNSVEEGIYEVDASGMISFCNRFAAELVGYKVDEVIGKHQDQIFIVEQVLLSDYFSVSKDMVTVDTNQVMYRRDFTTFLVEMNQAPLNRLNPTTGYVVTIRDISEQKKLELAIKQQGYYDFLTKLPNRLYFNEKFKSLLTEATTKHLEVVLMFIDLDRFKVINDLLGHNSGDTFLIAFSKILLQYIAEDVFVARIGGDEFTIVVSKECAKKRALEIANGIMERFSDPVLVQDYEFYISPSIGMSIFPDNGTDAGSLVKYADMAMYRGKEQGGKIIQMYSPTIHQKINDRSNMERHLHHALINEEFVLEYQPQISFQSGRVVGMEALIRWMHPEAGMIAPNDFISLAEENGLIVPIGDWVLRTACRQGGIWIDKLGKAKRVSVNLSARQLIRRNFASVVSDILSQTNYPAQYLELELTETILLHNTDSIRSTMHELKEIGVRISIDDFGTGYSSMRYLKDFPIDSLKIDQSFIKEALIDSKSRAITSSMITLAGNLGVNSIAEGVESEEQMLFLRSEGCNEGQGFYFSRPLAENMATLFLQSSQG